MKQHTLRLMVCGISLAIILLILPACASQPQLARIEEVTFESGSFHIVGDLRLPTGKAPFPVVLFVHGDGPVQTFNQVLQDQGYGPLNESFELFLQESAQHTPLSALPIAPEFLDLQEEWLRNLKP